MRLIMFLCVMTILIPAESRAEQDVKGGKDHPLIGRYEGSVMKAYYAKEFDEVLFVNKKVIGTDKRTKTDRNSERLGGKYTRISYHGPEGRSAVEVARNYQESLKAKGFQFLFSCVAAECSDNGGSWLFMAATAGNNPFMFGNYPSMRYVLAKLDRPEGAVWTAMLATEKPASAARPVSPQVMFDIVEVKGADMDKVVFVDAGEMARGIEETGKVALYGIQFDFDSEVIKTDSEPTLAEVSKLLKEDATLRLIIAGHTDGRGRFDYNVELSKRRAAAVVKELSSRYGIDAGRLRPFGAGMSAPIASNDTEGGRAKNRRVELVKDTSN